MESFKTNGDVIREMNDEDLAAWVEGVIKRGTVWFDYLVCDRCKSEHDDQCPVKDDEPCLYKNSILEYLRQPAGE